MRAKAGAAKALRQKRAVAELVSKGERSKDKAEKLAR